MPEGKYRKKVWTKSERVFGLFTFPTHVKKTMEISFSLSLKFFPHFATGAEKKVTILNDKIGFHVRLRSKMTIDEKKLCFETCFVFNGKVEKVALKTLPTSSEFFISCLDKNVL